jgi:uncharacterized protein YjbI with pentapeptide repeats
VDFQARSVGKARINETQTVVIDHQQLAGADFSGRKLVQFSAVGSRLHACRFDKSKIEGASFGAGRDTSEYVECSFDGVRIRFGPAGYARFVRCSFRDVDLRDWFCFTVELVDCTFSGRLRKAFFNGTVPEDDRVTVGRERNEFHGNDFSAMTLIDVGFRSGIDLTQQRLPSGPDYLYAADAAEAVQRARASVIGWDDLDLRQRAMKLVKILEENVAVGQRQLFLRPANYSKLGKDAVYAVMALLRGA